RLHPRNTAFPTRRSSDLAQAPASSGKSSSGCQESPREDAPVSMCIPALPEPDRISPQESPPRMLLALQLPEGTPLRVALDQRIRDRKSTRLNSSHGSISY